MRILLSTASESVYCRNSSFYQFLYRGDQFTGVLQNLVVAFNKFPAFDETSKLFALLTGA